MGRNDNKPHDGKKAIKEILMIEGGSSFSDSNNIVRKVFIRIVRTRQTEIDMLHFMLTK